jgi:hypothetical protein
MPRFLRGREPALLLALFGALVSLFSAYVVRLDLVQQGAVNGVAAVLVGLLTWRATRDGLSALILGLIKALIVLALAWHLHISAQNQALIYTLASAILAAFVRTQAIAPVQADPIVVTVPAAPPEV